MSAKRGALVARFQKLSEISPRDVLKMYDVFVRYYENAGMETFMKDLSEKEGAIVVRERTTGEVKGFSTIRQLRLDDGGLRPAIGVFSGDTILDHRYWGDRALKDGFVRYMLKLYLTHPKERIYWLLISKGYKTYLLMANNFHNYYPRWDKPNDPALQRMVQVYCDTLFPGKYDSQREVLDFGQAYQRLKGEVAPITEEERRSSPAIRYFEQCNPEWRRGVELPCVGEISLNLLWPYLGKELRKAVGGAKARRRGGDAVQQPVPPPSFIPAPPTYVPPVTVPPPAPVPVVGADGGGESNLPSASDSWNEGFRSPRGGL